MVFKKTVDDFYKFSIILWCGLPVHNFMLIYIYIITWYDYILLLWWWDVMRTRWLLRSTTGSYGLFVVETAYGEITSHSIEAIWEILAREKWLECRHDASPMFNIPESTPVWAQFMIFSDFHNIKYILCFKNLYVI